MKYVVYIDESGTAESRYTSIAACSLPAENWKSVVTELEDIVTTSNIKEFKWQKLKSAKYRFVAHKIIDLVISKVRSHEMRIDVILWDNHDSRNGIKGRDNTANFERMFYQLLASSMNKRPCGSEWGVYPDQRSGIDWKTATECLNNRGKQRSVQTDLPALDVMANRNFEVVRFREADSSQKPLVQVSDFFAGLAVFSVAKFEQYLQWDQENNRTTDMFGVPGQFSHSAGDVERFSILGHLDQLCKLNSLGVSLRSASGLRTLNPANPINFWRYVPQGAYDKAPTRS